jgi:hypothetical protein
MADLGRQALEAGARERDRLQQLGVAVARDDLGRDPLRCEVEPREDTALEVRRGRGVGPDGAGEGPDGDLGERPLESLGVPMRLEREAGELDPERRRLGVDPVRAPHADGVAVLPRPGGQHRDEAPGPGQDELPGAAELECQAGVEDVGAREAEVDPPAGRARGLREHVDERRDVVVGGALALGYRRDGERRGADRLEVLLGRSVHLLARRHLDHAHGLEARFVGPDRAQLGPRVAGNHAGIMACIRRPTPDRVAYARPGQG